MKNLNWKQVPGFFVLPHQVIYERMIKEIPKGYFMGKSIIFLAQKTNSEKINIYGIDSALW